MTLNPGKRVEKKETASRRTRPVDKESRLRRLGKWKDTDKKDAGGKKGTKGSNKPKKGTPTFKKSQKRN